MPVNTTRGDRAAIQSELLMGETTRWEQGRLNFSRLMSSNIKGTVTSKHTKMQSSPESPVVRVTDLSRGHGDHVVMDFKHRLVGLPRMGNADARGYEDDLHNSRYEIAIDVARYPVRVGSKLDKQRRPWDLDREARSAIADWSIRYDNELFMYHAMGARGGYKDTDLILPMADFAGPEGSFDDFMVNPLSPATHNRAFFAGPYGTTTNCISAPAGGFASGPAKIPVPMTGANTFSIDSVYRLQRQLEEMVNPPPKARFEIKNPNGGYKKTTPMYVLIVTPRMWEDMRIGPGFNDYAQLVANALKRCAGWDHPLFINDMLLAGDILVCKTPIPVRHYQGQVVKMRQDDKNGTIHDQQVPVGFNVDQGLLIGGQMLAHANGRTMSGFNWSMESEEYDYKYKKGYAIGRMSGLKKVTIRNRVGELYDHGCITMYAATTPQ